MIATNGQNVDRWGLAHIPSVQRTLAGWVRQVIQFQDADTGAPTDAVAAIGRWEDIGIHVLPVFNTETLRWNGQVHSYEEAMDKVAEEIDPTDLQLLNEVDGPHFGSSAPMAPVRYGQIIKRASEIFPHTMLFSAGVEKGTASIDEYLKHVPNLELLDVLCYHQYDMRVRVFLEDGSSFIWPDENWGHGDADFSLGAFRAFAVSKGIPNVAVTEWSTTNSWIQSEYVKHHLAMYQKEKVLNFHFHCMRDGKLMMPAPFGLFHEDGLAKPAYWSYIETAGALGGEVPPMATIDDAQKSAWQLASPNLAYNPDSAFAKEWRKRKAQGEYIGVPIGGEFKLGEVDGQPRAAQAFTSGVVLVWFGGDVTRSV